MTIEDAKVFLDNLKICINEHPVVADWLVEIANRKTEPTISKMEQVDKDINVRSKDEPQTEYKKWEMPKVDKPTEITTCVGVAVALVEDEPQTNADQHVQRVESVETMSCAECKHRPIGAEICEEPCHYEPQTDWHYDEQDATWYPYKHEDEPQQKSCATCKHALGNWDGESNNCGRCCGADRRFYEPKDEPQTDCAWGKHE